MKQLQAFVLTFITLSFLFTSCTSNQPIQTTTTDSVATNIKLYTHVWDEITNHGKLDMFNDSNFTKDVMMHENLTALVSTAHGLTMPTISLAFQI